MSKLFIIIVVFIPSFGQNLTIPCEGAVAKATAIHMAYVDGNATLREDLNSKKEAEAICKFKL